MTMYRNRTLLDLCHSLPCQCGQAWCTRRRSEPAHSNQQAHGKGWALKAHDCFVAALAHDCHRELDSGSRMTRSERRALWASAWRGTFEMMHAAGWIVLPSLGLDEVVHSVEGQVLVAPRARELSFVALPRSVPDEVWLDYWRTGAARLT